MRLNPDKVLIIVNSNPATIDVSLGAATWYAQVRGLTPRIMQFDFGTGADSDQLTCDAGISANMAIDNSTSVAGFDSWLVSVRDYVIANDIRCILMSACTPIVFNCKGPAHHTALRLFGGIKYLQDNAYMPPMYDSGVGAPLSETSESFVGFGVSEFGPAMFPMQNRIPLMFGRIGRYHFVGSTGFKNQLALETLDEVKSIVNNAIAAEATDNRNKLHLGSVNWRIRSAAGYCHYMTTSGSVTFAPGETSKNVKVRCYRGGSSTKTFEMGISNANGAEIYKAKETCSVKFDGTASTWSSSTYSGSTNVQVSVCGSTSVNCQNGDGTADFTIYLNKASAQAVTVDYATNPVTASARGKFLSGANTDVFFNSDASFALHYLKTLGFSNLSYFIGPAGYAGETGYESDATEIQGFTFDDVTTWNGYHGPYVCFAYFGVAFENTNYTGRSGIEALFQGVDGAWAYEKTSFGFGALGMLLTKNFSVVCGSLREPGAAGIPSHHAIVHALMHGYSFAEIVGMFPIAGDSPTNFMVAGDPLYAPYKATAPDFSVILLKKT